MNPSNAFSHCNRLVWASFSLLSTATCGDLTVPDSSAFSYQVSINSAAGADVEHVASHELIVELRGDSSISVQVDQLDGEPELAAIEIDSVSFNRRQGTVRIDVGVRNISTMIFAPSTSIEATDLHASFPSGSGEMAKQHPLQGGVRFVDGEVRGDGNGYWNVHESDSGYIDVGERSDPVPIQLAVHRGVQQFRFRISIFSVLRPIPTTIEPEGPAYRFAEVEGAPLSLSILVLDIDGNPVPAVRVHWEVAAGTLSAPSSETNGSGRATVEWIPAYAGLFDIRAIVADLKPMAFHVRSAPPANSQQFVILDNIDGPDKLMRMHVDGSGAEATFSVTTSMAAGPMVGSALAIRDPGDNIRLVNAATGTDRLLWRPLSDGFQPMGAPVLSESRRWTILPTHSRTPSGSHSIYDIWVIDVEGGGRTRVVSDTIPVENPSSIRSRFRDLSWWPDNRKIMFLSGTESADDTSVQFVARDGTGRTEFVTSPNRTFLSPQGGRVAYVIDHGDGHGTLRTVNADGAAERTFGSKLATRGWWGVKWSSDGELLVYYGPDEIVTFHEPSGVELGRIRAPEDSGAIFSGGIAIGPYNARLAYSVALIEGGSPGDEEIRTAALDGTNDVLALGRDSEGRPARVLGFLPFP